MRLDKNIKDFILHDKTRMEEFEDIEIDQLLLNIEKISGKSDNDISKENIKKDDYNSKISRLNRAIKETIDELETNKGI